jgi:hypothetical protein
MHKHTCAALLAIAVLCGLWGATTARAQEAAPLLPGVVPPVVSEFVPACAADCPALDVSRPGLERVLPLTWGVLGFRGYAFGDAVAPNGVEFNPFFTLDLDFNLWLWRRQQVYLFFDTRFWAQKPGLVTNGSQGVFDFSKRELDFTVGAAWTYYGNWEARVSAYSLNNLNRGDSTWQPSGFNDGIGLENRYYLTDQHARLGQADYDPARDPFVSVGYFVTKDMIDLGGTIFKPGAFVRANLTYDLAEDWLYLYLDTEFLAEKPMMAKFWTLDGGIAVRPFECIPNLEFRLGSEDVYDFQVHEWDSRLYLSLRVIF